MASDFTMHSGDDKTLNITITDVDGNAANLSGATAAYSIAPSAYESAVVSKATGGSGITIASNVVTVTLADTDTASLDGIYYHELAITDSSGNISTAMAGKVTIRKDV